MSSSPFRWQSRVRFGDTDASGRIFYASLLRHFDAAETEFLRHIDASYLGAGTEAANFPRVRLECDYTSMLKFDDLMEIAVTVDHIGRTSFRLAFQASVEGREAARAKLTIVCIDGREGKSMPLPDPLRAALAGAIN